MSSALRGRSEAGAHAYVSVSRGGVKNSSISCLRTIVYAAEPSELCIGEALYTE